MSNLHDFLIRVITIDGELVLEDTDFAEGSEWDVFNEILLQSIPGEVVQLIDNDLVLAEKTVEDL